MKHKSGNDGKVILHIDMDAFFVSVEQVLNPKLKGKPVIVGGDPNGRGVVSSASYEARKCGVHSAMPTATAKKLCPKGIFLRGSLQLYGEYSRRIMEILRRFTPDMEQVSVDEAYLDLTGCLRLHKADAITIAQRIHDAIRDEVGVPSSIGIASNRVTAKIAANMAKPNGLISIRPGCEAAYLRPLPIGKMPGVGPAAEKEYHKLGIRIIGDLLKFTPDDLNRVFGKHAVSIAAKARGEAGRQVTAERDDVKSVGREVTYSADTADPETLEATLSYLSENVGRRLRKTGFVFRRVTLKLRYSDFNTYTRSRVIEMPSGDPKMIFQTARELLKELFTVRRRVRLIGVTVSLLMEPERQIGLFANREEILTERLNDGLDKVRDRYGFQSALMARSFLYAAAMSGREAGGGALRV